MLSLVAYASLYVGGRDDGKKLGEAETETETETEEEAVAVAVAVAVVVAEQRQRETRETGERNGREKENLDRTGVVATYS